MFINCQIFSISDRDADLAKLTDNRIQSFSHDLVPNYLRSKFDPDMEAKHQSYENRANTISQDAANKQLTIMEKITKEIMKHINKERDEIESKANTRSDLEKTYDVSDTHALVAAISIGRGIKLPGPGSNMGVLPGSRGPGSNPGGPPPGVISGPSMNKAASSIKTNIKGASQVHPYARQ